MRRNILVTTYWSFNDPLIQTYTLPYLKIILKQLPSGSKIHLFTLEQSEIDASNKKVFELEKDNVIVLQNTYFPFGLQAIVYNAWYILKTIWYSKRNKIDTVHAWCMPGGAIGYIISKVLRVPLILDSYEPHAETMLESNTWKKNGLAFKLLFFIEKLISRHASLTIATTSKMKEYAALKYNVTLNEFYVKPACVDLEKFSFENIKNETLLEKFHFKGKIVGVYVGKFGGSYLTKEVFEIFNAAYEYWGENFRVLLLNNQDEGYICSLARDAFFKYKLVTKLFIKNDLIADYIGMADFAITPFVPVPSKRYGSPIKTGEYWALGLPVIITKDISDDSDIIREHDAGYVLEELASSEYRNAIIKIDLLIKDKKKSDIYNKIKPLAEKYRNYKIAEEIYKQVYQRYY